jgi:UDP-N-acetylglucosamine 2-epimerase (non-hydrolysing)
MKQVVLIGGIRPDWIRLSSVIEKLDSSKSIDLCVINSGQHYDKMLSDVFFQELQIRKPDFNLGIGGPGREHFQQLGDISTSVITLFRKENIHPDLVLFLGDSNSAAVSMPLKKEGYEIGHIEAGMRSGDKHMLEEINRTVCDHCSTFHFVYHQDYAANLVRENLPANNIFNVGNTIVEVCRPLAEPLWQQKKAGNYILLDIHRPENFKDKHRMQQIFWFAERCQREFGVPVQMLNFNRSLQAAYKFGLAFDTAFSIVELMSYKNFLAAQYHSLFMISDSGTAQEEPALLNTPVIVPRAYTERPQSMANGNSFLLKSLDWFAEWDAACDWVNDYITGCSTPQPSSMWLGDGHTAANIVEILEREL